MVDEQEARQLDQVRGARVVASRVEPDRGRVVRVREAELLRARIHHRDESGHRPVPDAERERLSSIVGARQQHREHQVVDAHPFAGREADLGVDRRKVDLGLGEHRIQRRVLEDDERRHQLRRAGDRLRLIGVRSEQALTRVLLDQDGRPCAQAGRLGAQAGRSCGKAGRRRGLAGRSCGGRRCSPRGGPRRSPRGGPPRSRRRGPRCSPRRDESPQRAAEHRHRHARSPSQLGSSHRRNRIRCPT